MAIYRVYGGRLASSNICQMYCHYSSMLLTVRLDSRPAKASGEALDPTKIELLLKIGKYILSILIF